MDLLNLHSVYNQYKYGQDNFHDLMQVRVQEILLVSTFYDAFIFEYDTKLTEQIAFTYHQLHLTTIPRVTSVPTGEEALRKLQDGHFDLVITSLRIGDISAFDLGNRIREKHPDLPVLLLLTAATDIEVVDRNQDRMGGLDAAFLWSGDPRLFLAMIKFVEDRKNAPRDTGFGIVRVILLVEDSISYASFYLPLLYTEIMGQTQRLISEELNDKDKYYRMRTRPKVILARNREEALELYERFREHLLCVISDAEFPAGGTLDPEAGIRLLSLLRESSPYVPMLLQSTDAARKRDADELRVDFLDKNRTVLLEDLRRFVLERLGFGDFVFRDASGKEFARARSLGDFERLFPEVPLESILFHSERNDFSTWLIAHGEFQVAKRLRPISDADFPSTEIHKQFLLDVFAEVRRQRNRGKILDFDPDALGDREVLHRIGTGSLGGKGRGLAFLNALLVAAEPGKRFPDVTIRIPGTVIIGTSEFDAVLETNHLRPWEMDDNAAVDRAFLAADLSPRLSHALREFLARVQTPLAVRSSGLLEDSHSLPFAGVYRTYMLPNRHPDPDVRLHQLATAVKLVYASMYLEHSRSYSRNLGYGLDEEKMAVVIQEIVGEPFGDHYYPHISGVAQSYNFYPLAPMTHSDGAAVIAVGLGHSVVDGNRAYRFCPRYPDIDYLSPEDQVKFSQTEFYTLKLDDAADLSAGEYATLSMPRIDRAEQDGTLLHLASVWDAGNQRLLDGLDAPGPRVVSFADILKYDWFPLAEILKELLDTCENAMGMPVEIEFAVDLCDHREEGNPTFYLLQVRPMGIKREMSEMNLEREDPSRLLLYSEDAMGHGQREGIRDIVYVDEQSFDPTRTEEIAREVESLNQALKAGDRHYVLVGPGRWGSRDRFLGVPVQWAQIDRVAMIVELGLEGFDIEPSLGAHFFHNLVAMQVGYCTVPFYGSSGSRFDREWLLEQEIVQRGEFVLHIRTDIPLTVKMDGTRGAAAIVRTEPEDDTADALLMQSRE